MKPRILRIQCHRAIFKYKTRDPDAAVFLCFIEHGTRVAEPQELLHHMDIASDVGGAMTWQSGQLGIP